MAHLCSARRYSAEQIRAHSFVRLPKPILAAEETTTSRSGWLCSDATPDTITGADRDIVRLSVTSVMSSSCSQSGPTNARSSARHA